MKQKVRIIIMSHLSDAQEMNSMGGSDDNHSTLINDHINFAKWLLIKFPNTDVECDPDEEYKLFQTKFTERLSKGI